MRVWAEGLHLKCATSTIYRYTSDNRNVSCNAERRKARVFAAEGIHPHFLLRLQGMSRNWVKHYDKVIGFCPRKMVPSKRSLSTCCQVCFSSPGSSVVPRLECSFLFFNEKASFKKSEDSGCLPKN
jgi:hypothetical protein